MSVIGASMGDLFGGAFDGRRVLVTGHTGFKGSWLCEWLLAMGADVTGYALDPPTEPSLFVELGLSARMRDLRGDVRDLARLKEAMSEAAPEVVFHLAAQPLVRLSYEEPVETYSTNVMGTVNVLEAVRWAKSVRVVVNVTSDKCYENREDGSAYREGEPMGGFDPYSSSKGCSELVSAAYRRSFFGEASSACVATARAGNVIGGGDWAADRIVPDCVRALQAGQTIIVRNPDAVRPWQHVLEPLSGYLLLAARMWSDDHAFDSAWNFGPESAGAVPVRRIVETLVAEWGGGEWETPRVAGAHPHEAKLLALDVSKARGQLAWVPLYDVDRAAGVTAAWYRARHDGGDVGALTRADLSEYVGEAFAQKAAWAAR